jgi:nucleotide-binding universal stress UspA family protein
MTITRVLVAVDFSPASLAALDYARDCALQLGGTLSVLHVIEGPVPDQEPAADAESSAVHQLTRRLASAPSVIRARITVLHAPDAADAIVTHAREAGAELIIMGLNGYEHGDFFMGSVAQQVVRQAPCPVMTLRAGSSRSPMAALP